MERSTIQNFLDQGLSLAEIGRRVGRHEATVAYWLEKYGLAAAHREKHAPRGRLSREVLVRLAERGLSVSQMAIQLDRSPTTVRHWLREYGIRTQWAQRQDALAAGEQRMVLRCPRHGRTEFTRKTAGGFRCLRCRSEAVSRRRRRVKQLLVEEAGGRCALCGYNRCVGALDFHHVNPADKRFGLSRHGVTRAIQKAREEASKCVLLCRNCHAEVEAGIAALSASAGLNRMSKPDPVSPG